MYQQAFGSTLSQSYRGHPSHGGAYPTNNENGLPGSQNKSHDSEHSADDFDGLVQSQNVNSGMNTKSICDLQYDVSGYEETFIRPIRDIMGPNPNANVSQKGSTEKERMCAVDRDMLYIPHLMADNRSRSGHHYTNCNDTRFVATTDARNGNNKRCIAAVGDNTIIYSGSIDPGPSSQELSKFKRTDEYSQSLFSQSPRSKATTMNTFSRRSNVDIGFSTSPPLEMEDDMVLSQLPKLPTLLEEDDVDEPSYITSAMPDTNPKWIESLEQRSSSNGPRHDTSNELQQPYGSKGQESATTNTKRDKQIELAVISCSPEHDASSKTPDTSHTKQATFKTSTRTISPAASKICNDRSPEQSSMNRCPRNSITSKLKVLKDRFDSNKNTTKPSLKSAPNEKSKNTKKSSFHVPAKKKNDTFEVIKETTHDRTKVADRKLQNVELMNSGERADVGQQLETADEVAMTIMYDDGSTQLREIVEKKRKASKLEPKAVSVILAYPIVSSGKTQLNFVAFPLSKALQDTPTNTENLHEWIGSTLSQVFCSKNRKLIFDAQEFIDIVTSAFAIHETQVILKWTVLDPKVACWLLNPDDPPVLFKQILDTVPELSQPAQCGSLEDQACADLSQLGPVLLHLYHQLKAQDLWSLFTDLEMPLCPVLACMQQRGIKVNVSNMVEAGDWLKKKLKKVEKAAFAAAGHAFLISSHQQLRQILFEELKLDQKLPSKKKVARTATNQHKSTSEPVLTQLSEVHTLPGLVLEYRQIQKVRSTYVDGLLPYVVDGHLKTHWDQIAAATGRLTSTNPNLQAVPKQPLVLEGVRDSFIVDKPDVPVEICSRDPFVAREGWSFLAADFQQIELRLLAHLSKDRDLLDVFSKEPKCDIFVELASQWLCKPSDGVTVLDREKTKRVVYSVMYGAGKDKLGEYLKISADNAKSIMMIFLEKFPGINSYTRKCTAIAREKGCQYTIFKRRRWFPHINHTNAQLRAQSERQAVNFCVQGSAADLCKAAMIQVEHALAKQPDLQARLLLQIHDELLLEAPDENIPKIKDLLKQIMESSNGLCGTMVDLLVPLKVNFSQGRSWGHMDTIEN